ncbi:MAG: HU family DNA-binding protein [Phycisphaerales bacterium]
MPDTITKKALVDRIADETDQKRVVVKKTIQTFLDLIIDELAEGNRLEFRDFGVFEVTVRAPRMAQNPKTLERVPVPAKKTVKFKVGRKMREELEAVPVDGEPAPEAMKPADAGRDVHVNETAPDQIRPRPRQTNPASVSA